MVVHEKLAQQADIYLESYRRMYEAADRAQRLLCRTGLDDLLGSALEIWSWPCDFWVPSYHASAGALPFSGKVHVTIALDGADQEPAWLLLHEALALDLFDEWRQDTPRIDGDKLITRWVAEFEEIT